MRAAGRDRQTNLESGVLVKLPGPAKKRYLDQRASEQPRMIQVATLCSPPKQSPVHRPRESVHTRDDLRRSVCCLQYSTGSQGVKTPDQLESHYFEGLLSVALGICWAPEGMFLSCFRVRHKIPGQHRRYPVVLLAFSPEDDRPMRQATRQLAAIGLSAAQIRQLQLGLHRPTDADCQELIRCPRGNHPART